MRKRTIQVVDRDLKRMKRARARLKRDLDTVTRKIAVEGGISGVANERSKILPTLRQLRELSRSLKVLAELLKGLEAEKIALAVEVEATDEYFLGAG